MNQTQLNRLLEQGYKHLQQGNCKAAIETFTQVLKTDAQSINAYANRSSAYADLGDYEHALEDLDRAIAIAPTLYGLYFNRGNLYKDLKIVTTQPTWAG